MTDKMREKIAKRLFQTALALSGLDVESFWMSIAYQKKYLDQADQIIAPIADSIKVRREYAFRQAGYGSGAKRAEFRAMVDAYDLILGDLKGGE